MAKMIRNCHTSRETLRVSPSQNARLWASTPVAMKPSSATTSTVSMPIGLPVCADESCHDRASLPALKGKYDMVNIKLDKTGGLTEALALREAARAEGYGIMVGCMVGSSLAMAPAVIQGFWVHRPQELR